MFYNLYGVGSYGFSGFLYGSLHIMMIVGIMLTIFAIAYFVNIAIQNKSSNMAYSKIPLSEIDILDVQFAKGEISEEEYKSRIDQLLR